MSDESMVLLDPPLLKKSTALVHFEKGQPLIWDIKFKKRREIWEKISHDR